MLCGSLMFMFQSDLMADAPELMEVVFEGQLRLASSYPYELCIQFWDEAPPQIYIFIIIYIYTHTIHTLIQSGVRAYVDRRRKD